MNFVNEAVIFIATLEDCVHILLLTITAIHTYREAWKLFLTVQTATITHKKAQIMHRSCMTVQRY